MPACAQFGGGYIGVHGGGLSTTGIGLTRAWAKNEVSTGLPDGAHSTQSGFEVGARIGYDWQRGCTLWGVVADWSWTNTSSARYFTDGQGAQQSISFWFGASSTGMKQCGARTGIVVDSVLLYTTGGWASCSFGLDGLANRRHRQRCGDRNLLQQAV